MPGDMLQVAERTFDGQREQADFRPLRNSLVSATCLWQVVGDKGGTIEVAHNTNKLPLSEGCIARKGSISGATCPFQNFLAIVVEPGIQSSWQSHFGEGWFGGQQVAQVIVDA